MTTTYPKPKGWPNPRLEQVTALKTKIEELEAQVKRLLEQAQRAEAKAADPDRMACGHPRHCIVSLGSGLYCAWCKDVARLEVALERAQAREAVLAQALEATWDARESMSYRDDDVGWVFHLDGHTTDTVREALRDRSTAAAALLERLAELESQVADLRGALQAALMPLEAAADALVPPGARVEEAAGLVDQALVVIREELE